MTDFDELKQTKAQCIRDITEALPDYVNRLNSIDTRLLTYIEDAISNNASHANLYELLGIRKTLRLMDSYKLDPERAHRKLKAIEGVWKNGRHVKGGLRFSTPRGSQHVRLMPFQVYAECTIHMFVTDVSMEREYHEGDELLPSEWVNPKDGMVWDTRRLIQEAHWFFTRKSGKTELGAAEDFTEVCFLGDVNGQALICTNSSEQSQIAYKAIREFAMQVDPTCSNRMGGKYFRMTRNGLNWQPGHPMKGEIKCMAAGKTSKDGLYASVVHADEHGQAGYVNAHSDMQAAVDTCWGSTGPRREKLLLHTTTAGRIKEGPYKTKLEQVEASLLSEMQYPLGQPNRTPDDYWCAILLQLDKWEQTDDLTKLDDPELFKKVNRSIGTTVQPTYYRERLHEAATGTEDTKQEVLTKDFNMWQSSRVSKWVSPDEIRGIQSEWPTGGYKCPRRIDDCTADQGWEVMVGSDFSKGDDLNGNSYLAKRWRDDLQEYEYFADLDAYMSEAAVNDSPIRALLMKWAEEGWLHIVPGKTFDPAVATNRIVDLMGYDRETRTWKPNGINFFGFGYDPYNAKNVVNALTQWLCDLGFDPKDYIKPVRQNFATYSPAVKEFDYMIHRGIQAEGGCVEPNPMIHLSENPLWPWEFGNCQLAESTDGMENMKPVKANFSASCKVDNVQMLLSALILHDMADGSITPT
ncbi:MAG: hypothetical protein IKG25_02730 [Mogibacterium sp.]|nr:hypothetical protein [Mogibacterium sp.]